MLSPAGVLVKGLSISEKGQEKKIRKVGVQLLIRGYLSALNGGLARETVQIAGTRPCRISISIARRAVDRT